MAVQIDVLQAVPHFAGLCADELGFVSKAVFERTVEKGGVILLEGGPAEALYFVISGAVKVFKTSAEGKEQILNIARPGESFNDVPVFDGGPDCAAAEAMTPVVLYGIGRADLETIVRDYPRVALNVINILAKRARHFVSLIEELSFKNVINRVARILLESATDGASSPPRLTQQDMAAMAGTAREMIGRSLKTLEEDGAIRLDRHRIIIASKEALKEIAGEAD